MRRAILFALAIGVGTGAAVAAGPAKNSEPVSILPNGNSKDPISIAADHLDYFQKENRAVYTGRVVVVQGDSKLTCSKLTIFMDKSPTGAPSHDADVATPSKADGGAANGGASSSVKHMDCAGPVTVVSKTQTATGDSGSYDKGRNNVILTGHVVMSDGRNVTKGDRLVYDLATGEAQVEAGSQAGELGRVTGLFLPGSSSDSSSGQKKK